MGVQHAAYVFQNECLLARSGASSLESPTGALVQYLQKGLLHQYIEAHLDIEGEEVKCDAPFSLLRPHVCSVDKTRQKRTVVEAPVSEAAGNPQTGASAPDEENQEADSTSAPAEPTAEAESKPAGAGSEVVPPSDGDKKVAPVEQTAPANAE